MVSGLTFSKRERACGDHDLSSQIMAERTTSLCRRTTHDPKSQVVGWTPNSSSTDPQKNSRGGEMRAAERVTRRADHNLAAEATGSSEVKLLIAELLVRRVEPLRMATVWRGAAVMVSAIRASRSRSLRNFCWQRKESFVGANSRSIQLLWIGCFT